MAPDTHRDRPWNKSPEWRAVARAAILEHHAGRHLLPKCGAKLKSTGEPCKNLPSPGRARCRLHGGATPRGDGPAGWHTPAFPEGLPTGKPRSDLYKKRRRWKTDERVDAMTPEQKARYDAWQASHAPGSAAKRAKRRQDRDAARWLADLMNEHPARTPHPRQARKPRAERTVEEMIRDRIGVFG